MLGVYIDKSSLLQEYYNQSKTFDISCHTDDYHDSHSDCETQSNHTDVHHDYHIDRA